MKLSYFTALALSTALALNSNIASAGETVNVTVQSGARQTFAGLGVSQGNWGRDYQKLSAPERAQLSRMLFGDLKLKTLRLWINLNEYAPDEKTRATADFRARYIDSGLIADAQKNGVVHLLLAPDNAPPYLKTKRDGGPEDFSIPRENLPAYAAVIADFIAQIQRETGVLIGVTGLQNEPNNLDQIAPGDFGVAVQALRAALDERGLQAVQIIAPEQANVDSTMEQAVDAIKADPQAWSDLSGIASHSYNMAATEKVAQTIAAPDGTNLKNYWQTEASANGPEAPGDDLQAASLATRFLSDMNHRVTHWIHFLGAETPDPNDNATRILAYTTNPLQITKFRKYDYYRALAQTFDVGAQFRHSLSDKENEMTWTYGPKPRVTVAAARNPDGTWGIGISNFTAPNFAEKPSNDGYANGYGAQTFDVTVKIPELKGALFTIHRNGPNGDKTDKALMMRDGILTITNVSPLELVTLRSLIIDLYTGPPRKALKANAQPFRVGPSVGF